MAWITTPAWATGAGKNDQNYYQKMKNHFHQMMVRHQFWLLKFQYDRSHPDAQRLFMNYVGTTPPSCNEEIAAVRAEYDQQIAQLNASIASYQRQLDNLASQMNAACDTRLEQAQASWEASTQQQLNALNTAHETAIIDLTAQMNAACDQRLAEAQAEWQASANANCPQATIPPQVTMMSTGARYPYALDKNSSGDFIILDKDNKSISRFNANGTVIAQWSPTTLVAPVDIALDSQNNFYILDQSAAVPLQKFTSTGTPAALATSDTPITFGTGLFIDNNDQIYVSDLGGVFGPRVLTYNTSGTLLGTFGEVSDLTGEEYRDIVVDSTNQLIYVVTEFLVAKFAMNGDYLSSWVGDFRSPYGIAVAKNGNIFIADTFNNEIDVYDTNGNLRFNFVDGLYRPSRIVTDDAGQLVVADYRNMRIKIYK